MRVVCALAPAVISDTLEGDTIVINVQTGAYYTLTPPASRLWAQAQADGACEVDDLTDPVLRALVDEGLLVDEWDGGSTAADSSVAFSRFTDMEELLLADPIHEVDAEGWPVLKPPVVEA